MLYGQCSKGMQSKIKARKNWNDKIYNNPIKLLSAIKECAHNYQDERYPVASTVKAMKALMNMRKADNENLVDYARRFANAKDVCKLLGGQLIFKKLIESQEDCNL